MGPATRKMLVCLGMVVWAVLASYGFAWLWRYAGTPGPAADAPAHWPADAALTRDQDRHALVMIVHPECACSRASVHELSRLVARAGGRVAVFVLVDVLHGHTVDPSNELQALASAIPGAVVRLDAGGREAHRFGARTSGHTFLFDPSGRLVFDGGITAARGHQGDNPGALAVSALIAGRRAERRTGPVFGCLLAGADAT